MDQGRGKAARRRAGQGPTVNDVARHAGVSAMTVSRVANRDARVLAATRERVEASIRELGYIPNTAARSLAAGRQRRIALLHSNPSSAYLSEFLMGALAEAGDSDAELVVERCDEGEPATAMVERLNRHRVDAVLLPPPLADDEALLAALSRAGLPMVQVATGRPSPLAHAVTIDDEAAAHALTALLIASGHRRIGLIVGNPNQTASALRKAGYERALREAGIAPDVALIAQGDFTWRSGFEAATRLLALADRPTAIFASNDDMAAAALTAAHRAGLDVPRELSVCGFDDTAIATTVWPELTTVRQPVADMAREATRLLISAIDADKAEARHRQLPFSVIERASTAAPQRA